GGVIAGSRARHERRFAGGDRCVWIGASLQQQADHRVAGVRARLRQRRHFEVVDGVGIGARVDQQGGRLEIVPIVGPQERRRPVGRSAIHVGMLRDERSYLRPVLFFRSVDEVVVGGNGGNCREEGDERRAQDALGIALVRHWFLLSRQMPDDSSIVY